MASALEVGDHVRFKERSPQEVTGKTGVITQKLGVHRMPKAFSDLYEDVIMWEVQLDKSKDFYPSAEDWLDKIR